MSRRLFRRRYPPNAKHPAEGAIKPLFRPTLLPLREGGTAARSALPDCRTGFLAKGVGVDIVCERSKYRLPRRPRIKLAGLPQHLLQRGVNREPREIKRVRVGLFGKGVPPVPWPRRLGICSLRPVRAWAGSVLKFEVGCRRGRRRCGGGDRHRHRHRFIRPPYPLSCPPSEGQG